LFRRVVGLPPAGRAGREITFHRRTSMRIGIRIRIRIRTRICIR
jgi:hypothetical protein